MMVDREIQEARQELARLRRNEEDTVAALERGRAWLYVAETADAGAEDWAEFVQATSGMLAQVRRQLVRAHFRWWSAHVRAIEYRRWMRTPAEPLVRGPASVQLGLFDKPKAPPPAGVLVAERGVERGELPDAAGEGLHAPAVERGELPDAAGEGLHAPAVERGELPDAAGEGLHAPAVERGELPDAAGEGLHELPGAAGEGLHELPGAAGEGLHAPD